MICYFYFFFFKQKTAYEMRISDWSSDVCSSDLLDHQPVGQRVDHRDADAVQAAGGGIDLGGKFAAGMQRGEDHLQRRLVLEFRMPVDRDAEAVVHDPQAAIGLKLDLDAVGVAGDGLVHGIVEHLGKQVVQGPLVGAADIHEIRREHV